MTVDEIRRKVEEAERATARRAGQRDHVKAQLAEVVDQRATARAELEAEEAVQDILTKASALTWAQTKGGIETLVNRALRAVFTDRDYKFVIEQETKRGTSSVNFVLVEDGVETDVWDESGLGVADVIGFALRVAFLSLNRPKLRQFMVFDEPFKNMARCYVPNAARLVKQVASELGIQIVMVTHDQEFIAEADQVVRLDKDGDSCRATEMTAGG